MSTLKALLAREGLTGSNRDHLLVCACFTQSFLVLEELYDLLEHEPLPKWVGKLLFS